MIKPKTTAQTADMLHRAAFAAAQRIFPCETAYLDYCPMDEVAAAVALSKPAKRPFLLRIAGQSGSGKSSQLTSWITRLLKKDAYTLLNVSMFAPFHPLYADLQKKDKALLREKTNGFALKMLLSFYEYCILRKVNIVLDITLLEPDIEDYFMRLAKENGYLVQMHLLCVPKKISDFFIRQRQRETGRVVALKSSDYFFNALPRALKHITRMPIFDVQDRAILWSHCYFRPVYFSALQNRHLTTVLGVYQSNKYRQVKNKAAVLKAKKNWLTLCLNQVQS